jgi:hypothetical protein
VDFREFFRKLDLRPLRFRGWASQFSFFTLAVLLALVGHLAFAGFLNALAAFGVDFEAIDASHNLIPALQILLFAVQTGLIVWAIAKVGIPMKKTLLGIAAMFWAAAMLMITFVSAQCDLYGACL